ncbi:MAG: hypothetical protein QE285_18380 [Aquabacterium sp.]|nr:hypothetical protein [Aquabacterium sp.]
MQPKARAQPGLRRRRWTWLLLALVLLPAAAVALGLWLAIESAPRVDNPSTAVSVADIDRARQLLTNNDPRRALPGITRAVLLSQRDLELLIQQASRRLGDARGRVRLQPGLAVVEASLALPPALPGGGWLNLRAVLRETDALPQVQQLHIGRLPVPGWLAQAALPRLLAALNLRAQGELAQRLVSRVGFRAQALVLAYAWPDNAGQAITASLLPPGLQARLRRHADLLATLGSTLAAGKPPAATVSVVQVLQPVFALAARHSPDADTALQENRAALVALAFLAAGQPLAPLLGNTAPSAAQAAGRANPRGPRLPELRLQGRPDFPQHLLISAALAVEGGGPLADAIGLYKEVADARHGSGFSFNDIAADRAGIRLGLLARRDPLAFQARLANGLTEADLMPDVSDLPEFLSAGEFKRRYGGVGTPAYQAMLREIEVRLNRLPLLAGGR